MMRRALSILLSASVIAAPAAALASAQGLLDRAFGNTIVSTYPDGRKAELYLSPGGDYQLKSRKGQMSSGHWKVSGQKLCLSQSRPFPAPFEYCTPLPTGQNTTWTARAFTGETVSVRLVPGHV